MRVLEFASQFLQSVLDFGFGIQFWNLMERFGIYGTGFGIWFWNLLVSVLESLIGLS